MKTLAPGTVPSRADPRATLEKLARILSGRYDLAVTLGEAPPRLEDDVIVLPRTWADQGRDDELIGSLDQLVARLVHSRLRRLPAFRGMRSRLARAIAQAIDDHRCARRLIASHPGAARHLAARRAAGRDRLAALQGIAGWDARYLQRLTATLWHDDDDGDDGDASELHAPFATQSVLAAWQLTRTAIESARDAPDESAAIAHAMTIVSRLTRLRIEARNNSASLVTDPDGDAGADGQVDDDDPALDDAPDADDTLLDANDPSLEAGDAWLDDDAASRVADPATRGAEDGPAPAPTSRRDDDGAADAEGGSDTGIPPIDATDSQLLEHRSPAGAPLYSVPTTRRFDRVVDHSGQGDPDAWRRLLRQALNSTGRLADKLERALRADEQRHWRFEQERGQLSSAHLARLAVHRGYRTPFKVERRLPGRQVAVTILVDLSASMSGEKIDVARLCSAAMAHALHRLDYPFEVIGFSSAIDADMRAWHREQVARGIDLRRYNRFVERLDLQVYKSFDSDGLSGIAAMRCGQQNPDGEALAWAAARLQQQRRPRRVMFVLSDGHPVTGDGNKRVLQSDLRLRIAALRRAGIELVGIGIGDDAAASYYDDAIVVRDPGDLPKMAFGQLSDKLLGRANATPV